MFRCEYLKYRCIFLRVVLYFDELAGRVKIQTRKHLVKRYIYCNTVLLSQEYCLYFVGSNNFVKAMGVSGTRIGFFL